MLAQLMATKQQQWQQSAKGRVCSLTACPWCSPALAAPECDPSWDIPGPSPSQRSEPALRALEELTRGDQSRDRFSATTAPFEKDHMAAGSPLPGILLSVPDCDQETLLLILLLHWAGTRRGHSPSASPGALSKGCPRSHRLLSVLRARSSPPVSAQSSAAICSFLADTCKGM